MTAATEKRIEPRLVKQIAGAGGTLYVLANDGTLWVRAASEWTQIPALPPIETEVDPDGASPSDMTAASERDREKARAVYEKGPFVGDIAAALAQARADRDAEWENVTGHDEHLGYEAERDAYSGCIDGWYCRDPLCSQPFGKPHLDDCKIGPPLAAIRAGGTR